MVYQTVDEQIETATIYKQGEVKPVAFRWGNKKYFIDKVNLIHTRYEGAIKCYFFSVSTKNGGEYQLKYNTDSMKWTLDQLYLE
jgi:hypothetical protein